MRDMESLKLLCLGLAIALALVLQPATQRGEDPVRWQRAAPVLVLPMSADRAAAALPSAPVG